MLGKDELLKIIGTREEEDLRHFLCELIGCDRGTAPTPAPTGKPVVTIQGDVSGDAFLFTAKLGTNAENLQDVQFQLDTGAFEMLLTADVAGELLLPDDGPLDISGVTGSSPAYKSHVTVQVTGTAGNVLYADVPCTVDPSFTGTPLFGFRFFKDEKLALTVNPVSGLLTWTHAE